jgi:hypothetical protein
MTTYVVALEALPPLNANYDPPQPWKCITSATHDCDGPVIGKVGAYPVCANGATAEIARRNADDARLARLYADPEFQRLLAQEARIERRLETDPPADQYGNRIAREGCSRCWCGCKYWEQDRCADCSTPIWDIPAENR